MKRLLLAPLLIAGLQSPANALPWDDVVVKTDLGEKMIVKKSATRVEKYDKEYVIKSLYTRIEMRRQNFNNCLSSLGKRWCQKNYAPDDYAASSEQLAKDFEQKETQKLIAIEVMFKPIYEDLNGNKSVMNRRVALCRNPKISNISYDAFLAIGTDLFDADNTRRRKNSNLAIDQAKIKLCDKYAKF
tara:strand:- start:773 stop:1333 length:561 start_codon:yes stop_codon:yes gene_type:complete